MKSVNGTPVKNLEGLVAAVEECKEHFLRFQLEYSQVLPSAPQQMPLTCMLACTPLSLETSLLV